MNKKIFEYEKISIFHYVLGVIFIFIGFVIMTGFKIPTNFSQLKTVEGIIQNITYKEHFIRKSTSTSYQTTMFTLQNHEKLKLTTNRKTDILLQYHIRNGRKVFIKYGQIDGLQNYFGIDDGFLVLYYKDLTDNTIYLTWEEAKNSFSILYSHNIPKYIGIFFISIGILTLLIVFFALRHQRKL